MGRLGITLWWGPGRHGPGNNLFFMIEDPDGHKVEFSAELVHVLDGVADVVDAMAALADALRHHPGAAV